MEQLCLKHGFQFHAIDLRWGVSTEAGLDHRTMRICFEELRRSQEISPEPNFLILLGNRYDWQPLPEEISQEEFDRLVIAAKSGGGGRQPLLGTHGKSAEDVLNEWYRCDRNVLVPTDPVAVHDRAPLNYILQPRTQHLKDGRDYTRTREPCPADTQDWLDVQQVLWSIINAAFAVIDAGTAESGTTFEHRFDDIDWPRHIAEVHAPRYPQRAVPQIVRFQGSATEQEIWCGTLSEADARQHVLAFVREIDNLPTPPRLAGLKNFVDQANCSKPGQDASDREPRARLTKFFAKQDYFLESLEDQRARARRLPPTPRPSNIRKVDELPWQLLEVAKHFGKDDSQSPHWNAIVDLFTDLNFLEAKAEAAE